MSAIEVHGLQSLKGEIKVQGSKNAILPIMAAAILHKGTTVIENVPRIQDVFCMLGILKSIGCECQFTGHRLTIDASEVSKTEIPKEFVKSMRSSIIVSGPLLSRLGEAITSFPGGCSIGERPIDLHFTALRALGARVCEEGEEIRAAAGRLAGADIYFPFPSVGATENGVMAAVLADGVTVIHGAAREPEVGELCRFLNGCGACIKGIGTSRLAVTGVKELHDSVFPVAGDRIVAGTYLCAVMAAGGEISMTGIVPEHLESVLFCAEQMGADIRRYEEAIAVSMVGRPDGNCVITGPYPEFPTDLQSPMMAVMAAAASPSRLEETIFEGRFGTAKELQKLGADIIIEENRAIVHGLYPLKGGTATAKDLRGGAALVVAGLASEEMTHIDGCSHIERGYEDICQDLGSLGAVIRGIE